MTFSVLNLQRLKRKANALGNRGVKAMQTEIAKGTLAIAGTAVKDVQKRSPGSQPGVRYNPKRAVQVSPEGQAPNTDTGRLVQSIGFNLKDNGLTGFAGTNLKYGRYLELGTLTVKPRPWLRPAFKLHKPEIIRNIKKALKNAAKSAARLT